MSHMYRKLGCLAYHDRDPQKRNFFFVTGAVSYIFCLVSIALNFLLYSAASLHRFSGLLFIRFIINAISLLYAEVLFVLIIYFFEIIRYEKERFFFFQEQPSSFGTLLY